MAKVTLVWLKVPQLSTETPTSLPIDVLMELFVGNYRGSNESIGLLGLF